jgi:hypothetical protein
MQKEAIIAAIDGALEATRGTSLDDRGTSVEDHEFKLGMLLHYAVDEPKRVDPRIPDLITTLATDYSLEIFNGRMVVWPSMAMRVEYRTLAGWLISRGSEVGSAQAADELARYVDATEIPCLLTLALSGIKVEGPCDLADSVRMLPWDALPDSTSKRWIHRQSFAGFPIHFPTAAMVREEVLPKRHLTDDEFKTQTMRPIDDTGLHDAILCAGMIGPTAPYPLASFLTAPPWVPVMTGGIGMPFSEGRPVIQDWSSIHCSEAAALHFAFLKLGKERKDLLRLAMQRLNRAMRRHFPVDAAIDLGIALEALFLSDLSEERGEPTFRLKIRAARYLGSTKADRDALFNLVGDLYGARSSAVHTGRVSDQVGGRPIGDVLAEGYSVAAGAIRRMIIEGQPDWRRVMLG